MKKSVVICVSIVAAFAVVADSALAQQAPRPRRKSFFEALFGSGENSDRNQPRRFGRQKSWWEEDPNNGVNIIYGTQPQRKSKANLAAQPAVPKVVKTAFIDPEVSEGLGMGNIPYIAPRQMPVFEPAFAKLAADGTEASAIKVILTDRKTDIRAVAAVRKVVLDQYKANAFKPLWVANGNLTPRGAALLKRLQEAEKDGLEPKRYKPPVLESFEATALPAEGDNLGLAQLDVGLSVAALTFAVHMSGGAYDPALVSAYNDIKTEGVDPAFAMKILAAAPFPDAYLNQLQPKHPAYAALKAELDGLLSAADAPTVMEEGKRVRIGQKDPRILVLRQLLVKEGYLDAAAAEPLDGNLVVLDKTLAKALKAFQEAKGIAQTSNLDAATVNAFNGPNTAERREQLISNLERVRWLPKNLGARHVFVNQASYGVEVMDGGKRVWQSRVIVGRPMTQTAVFSDVMETVVFNPSWGVPQSILLNEYLPKLRRNPGYLDKIGFKVVNGSGEVVKSSSINWNGVGSGSAIGVQQPPGDSNALGELKFLFPNKHSIYMHDTPNRQLFAEPVRNFSHGCVRVENPREFASVLLEWDRERVNSKVETGESTSVPIARKPLVHLTYFTAWPDDSGKIQYYSDAYGRDAALKTARAQSLRIIDGVQGQEIVENAAPKTPAAAAD